MAPRIKMIVTIAKRTIRPVEAGRNFAFFCFKLRSRVSSFLLSLFVLFVYRKADLRELKVLQRMENKQYQDLVFKAQYLREQQERKFEQEMQVDRSPKLLSYNAAFYKKKMHYRLGFY